MRAYLLTLSCVSGDEVRIAIRRREDIVPWLRRLEHSGAQWSVVQPVYDGHRRTHTRNLTAQIEAEYRGTGDLTARIDQAYRTWRVTRRPHDGSTPTRTALRSVDAARAV